RSLPCQFESETFVSHLIHPNTRRDGHCALQRSATATTLRRRSRLSAKLPTAVDKFLQRIFRFKHKDGAEFLYAHAQARLDLTHLHVRDFLRSVINRNPTSPAGPGDKDLRARAIE